MTQITVVAGAIQGTNRFSDSNPPPLDGRGWGRRFWTGAKCLIAGLLGLSAAAAQQYIAIPGTSTGTNTNIDAAGNVYTFTASALIKTTPAGVQTTLATAYPAPQPQGPYQQGPFMFTNVVVDSLV
jgi:hypothetical protein